MTGIVRIYRCAVILLLSIVHGIVPSEAIESEDLVGLWLFNDGIGSSVALDISPNGNHGAVRGPQYVQGRFGMGLDFDGVDDFVDAGSDASLNLTRELSITVWVFPKGAGINNGIILLKQNVPGTPGASYGLGYEPQTQMFFQVLMAPGHEDSQFYGPAEVSTWHHLAITYNAVGVLRSYVDGQLRLEQPLAGPGLSGLPDGPLHFGQQNASSIESFFGIIDELAIFNRALSQAEISQIMTDGLASTVSCLATELPEESCEDGVDNDCDGEVDGTDSDCAVTGPFIRGDCDGNGGVGGSPTEAVILLNFAFRGGPRPDCLAACDAEANGSLGITDALRILRHSFLGLDEPDPPFPDCVASRLVSDAMLGCELPQSCP